MPTVAALVWGNYGRLVSNGSVAAVIIISVVAINVGLIIGSRMWAVPLATDISRLWIDPNSDVAANNELIRVYGNKIENGLNELVTLSNADGSNMATAAGMTRWAAYMDAVLDTVVYDEITNSTYTMLDICNGRSGQTAYTFGCSMTNPIDYFAQGGKFFPADAAAQWLLDTRLAYPAVNPTTGTCLSTTCRTILWGWALQTDLAASSVQRAGIYTGWFSNACLTSSKVLCQPASNLLTKVDDLISRPLFPPPAKFQFSWIKAQLVLGGIIQGAQLNGAPSTCNVTGNPFNMQTTTTTDAITFAPALLAAINAAKKAGTTVNLANGQTYSMANCGISFAPPGACTSPPTFCPPNVLSLVSPMDFSSPCASCIIATMWWMGELNFIQTGIQPVADPSSGILTLPGLRIWNTSSIATGRATSAGIAQQAATGAAALGAATFCNETHPTNNIKPSTCVTLFDGFYTATVAGLTGNVPGALATIPGRVTELVGNPNLDPLAELKSVFGGSKDLLDASFRDLMVRTSAIPDLAGVLRRHGSRANFSTPGVDVAEVLSGFKNDLATQNLRPAIFGGASPSAREIKSGRCSCNPGFSGLTCNRATDLICDCDSNLRTTCIGGLLGSCVQMATCAGYTAITTLVAGAASLGIPQSAISSFLNFQNDILVGTAFARPSTQPGAIGALQTHCQRFLGCTDAYNVSADPVISGAVPSSYHPIAASAIWNAALLSDLSTPNIKSVNRGRVLLTGCLLDGPTCLSNADVLEFAANMSIVWSPAELGTLGVCSSTGTAPQNCAANETNTALDWTDASLAHAMTTRCPRARTFYAANPPAGNKLTYGIYFACMAEAGQPLTQLPGPTFVPTVGRSGAAAALAVSGSKPLACSAGPSYSGLVGVGVSNVTCIRAWTTFIWNGMEQMTGNPNLAALQPAITLAFGASATTPTTARQRSNLSQLFAGLLASNAQFVADVSAGSFSGCTTYGNACPTFTTEVNTVLTGSCAAASVPPLFVPVALEADACSALLTNLLGALGRVPSSLAVVSRALAKYKFMGTVFGSCGATGVQNGGGECWANGDCGNGVCANLSSKVTLQNVTTLAFILQTNEPEGTVSFMRRFDTRYRALANKPIIDRYVAKLASQTGRRLETIQLGNPNGNASLTLEDAARIITNWRREMARNVKNFRDASASTANANVYTADSASDLLNDISEADTAILVLGYGLMLLYTFLSCTNWSTDVQAMMNGSRALVGQAGIILVAISVASGLGVSHLLKVEWSAAATQIVPFVMLGLGVSDTFVMLRIWPYYQDGVSAADAAAKALTIAGPPMLLVSATNAGVFAVGVLTAMPVVVNFALQAVIVVIANYFTTNLALPALLVMDYKRMAAGRADMLPCIKVGTSARAQVSAQDTGYEENVFNRWCTPYYASCLLSVPGKLFVLAWSAAFLGSAIYGVERYAELGLQLSDIAPVGSELANALITRDSQFGFYTVGVVTSNADWSLREVQQGIVKVFNDVMASDYVVDGSGTPWMQVFMSWGQVDTPLYSTTAAGEICSQTSSRTSGFCGKNFNCTVVTADDSVVNGSIPFYPRADFKRCLSLWVQYDIGYEAIKPSFPLVDAFAPRSSRVIDFTPSSDPLAAFLPFTRGTLFAQNLRVNADFVQLINELRAVANNQTTPPSFPIGEPIDFWDQYVSLRQIINTAVGYGLLICFLTIWFLLMCLVEGDAGILKRIFATFWASALTTGIIALSVYEIYGYMAFGGLKISAIPAISIIMSTGVAVEYTAYIAVAFVNGSGSLNERARHALMLMLAPVVDGAVTMFLGVVMLAASPFLFIVKYFFYPWLLIIFFGMFNGIAFLPVLFSFVGPPAVMSGASKTEALSVKQ